MLELGLLTEERLGKALSEQLGVPLASADDLRVIADGVLELIPSKLACRSKVVPFERYGNSISVAMLDTRDLLLQDELGFVVSKRLRVHVAAEIRILEALDKHYHCGVEPRYNRIWDRLNRSRFLWQEEGGAATPPGRRPPAEPAAMAAPPAPPNWQPTPPPPLESGVTRLSAAGVSAAATARPAAAATDVLPVPPPPATPPPRPAAAPATAPAPSWLAPDAAPETPAAAPPPTPAPRSPVKPVPVEPPHAAAPAPLAALPQGSPVPPSVAAPSTTPAPAPDPAARRRGRGRDEEATSPLVVPAPVATLAELQQRLADVDARDDVAYAALSFLERRVSRRLLFMVRGSEVAAWMGSGEGVDQRALNDLAFAFDQPSAFLNLREGSPFYRGPLARLDAHQRLVKVWGGRYPRECLMLPVRVKDRLVAVVYCDRGGEDLSGIDVEELQAMAAAMGHAFETFLRKKKGVK
jgi:hypothetical protein